MMLKIYSIRDSKAGVYNPPFFLLTHGEAERSFKELTRDANSMVHKYPEDYDLYFLGEYDKLSGAIMTMDTPQHIAKALSFAGTTQFPAPINHQNSVQN